MRMEWNTAQYMKFEGERNQPAVDLLNRIRDFQPTSAVDLGCGPGNSTALVCRFFPEARVLGLDSSPAMIKRAGQEHPDLEFRLMDVQSLKGQYDLIFSNACLQWIPNHPVLIPNLLKHLKPGGVFAAQIPMNAREPLFQIIQEVTSQERWGFSEVPVEHNGALPPEDYFDILSAHCESCQVWETKYCHPLPNHQALLEWVKGSRLRPYLERLDHAGRALLEEEILRRAKEVYPIRESGGVLLRFNRFFMIGNV